MADTKRFTERLFAKYIQGLPVEVVKVYSEAEGGAVVVKKKEAIGVAPRDYEWPDNRFPRSQDLGFGSFTPFQFVLFDEGQFFDHRWGLGVRPNEVVFCDTRYRFL
jgi:hypothetical protein